MDSQVVITILQDAGNVKNQFLAEVLTFREIVSRYWEVGTQHVYREVNRATNFLVNRVIALRLAIMRFLYQMIILVMFCYLNP
ncbi:hypothetical protein LINPERPRIM_LOCUS21715 [Linum perenne]